MLKILGIVSILFGAAGFFGVLRSFKQRGMKENGKLIIYSMVFIFIGWWLIPSSSGNTNDSSQRTVSSVESSNSVTDRSETTQTTDDSSNSDKPTAGNYSPENPVPDQYLQDFIAFMKQYNNELHEKVYNSGSDISEAEWGALLGKSNQEGWDRYQEITYVTNFNIEKQEQFKKRTDVAEAWVMLQSLSMTYDSYLRHSGKAESDVEKDETEYNEAIQKAINEMK